MQAAARKLQTARPTEYRARIAIGLAMPESDAMMLVCGLR